VWPRGVKKAELNVAGWMKDVAPSVQLRKWFSHDSKKWKEFQERYKEELERKSDSWHPLLAAAQQGTITLVYSAADPEHNNAIVLKEYLKRKGRPG
jgi:uncharacterized protein YeaO (DUF488 family)